VGGWATFASPLFEGRSASVTARQARLRSCGCRHAVVVGALDGPRARRRERADTIEHILPQTPKKEYWRERFDKSDQKLLIHDLGNLALTKDNSSYSNKPFPDKKGKAGIMSTRRTHMAIRLIHPSRVVTDDIRGSQASSRRWHGDMADIVEQR
jgi:hypothetical protein